MDAAELKESSIQRHNTDRKIHWLAASAAVAAGLVLAAVPFVTQMDSDATSRLPAIRPAPSVATQLKVLAEFARYPPTPQYFGEAIRPGSDANGLQTLLNGMVLTRTEGREKVYRYTLASKMDSEDGITEVAAFIRIDGTPARVVSTWVDLEYRAN